ncbi:type III secretion system needle filament subunit SctF [Candidatus Fukatsuia symbiotica]|uniref:EscF/YscF/HrpA family type III secretion system needle major subunit n=1 Tax=Candidatus Fukatsuia symbiotica TaxID=1878942 RepID=A0A2U8I4C5_9GAMM|nr:type III secretion system needle filament subunit SctF [Candidatus Fukatsuia symbiotica]AWK13992.1 EscF/YscF/HrpA family type III secretion system needle major subunit [Candidatus Fukatsuia symbiotica]MEA9445663.1 type III secretion system needle filament subunit SctF [Candidatus Fukatsuia symbiotica]
MDIQQILDSISRQIARASQSVENKMSTSDLQNPAEMMKMQFALQQYSNFVSFGSSVTKKIFDVCSGIIAKI